MDSGAVEIRPRIWLSAWVRPLRAEARATRKTRMDSTFPSLVLASPAASPERAARAAGGQPASIGTCPFDAQQFDRAEVGEPAQQLLVAALCGGEALDAEERSS